MTVLAPAHPAGPARPLASLTVFVGGPIKAGFTDGTFDPVLRHRVDSVVGHLTAAGARVISAHQEEGFAPLPPGAQQGIVGRDFGWLRQCDIYVPLLPLDPQGTLVPSLGTGVEVGWATALGTPAVLLVETARIDRYSPFLRGLPDAFPVQLMDLTEAVESPTALAGRLAALRRTA
ncbi:MULTISPECIES: nucleoside 2-deoxyribosyltransferase [Streptomyces]|uniref:nucleoside 2-deoxyribosyltransferase n=1 Tax=Streptomyces TaxID=1883 RepID=UPI00068FFCB0|nr:nucleoside 2-deoxyribosyltransferase [Streptomyces durhamensis]